MSKVDFDKFTFSGKLHRLKFALNMSKDKDVAEALGLTDKAFNARKARGAFPRKELYELAVKRPELNLDIDFILTGLGPKDRAIVKQVERALEEFKNVDVLKLQTRETQTFEITLSSEEIELLVNYRSCSEERRRILRQLAGL